MRLSDWNGFDWLLIAILLISMGVAYRRGIVRTLCGFAGFFGGLTVAVFVSGKDFSFMGPFLWVAGLLALALVLTGAVFGFSLGLVFCAAMVALAAGYIIYDTSNIIHRYGTNEHVAASLELFASVALLFWYVLRIFWAMNQDD